MPAEREPISPKEKELTLEPLIEALTEIDSPETEKTSYARIKTLIETGKISITDFFRLLRLTQRFSSFPEEKVEPLNKRSASSLLSRLAATLSTITERINSYAEQYQRNLDFIHLRDRINKAIEVLQEEAQSFDNEMDKRRQLRQWLELLPENT